MAELNAAGSITGTDGTVEIAPGDNAAVAAALEGTWVATVNYEVTYDGVRWDAAQVFTLAGVSAAATATTNIDRLIDARGAERVRVRANPYTSGTINVVLSAGEGVVAAGGGGGGGAVTIADGADVTQGTTTDTAAAADTTNATVVAFWKRLLSRVTVLIGQLPTALVGGRLDVNVGATAVTQPVSGTVTANAGTGPFPIQATAAAPASVELSDGAAFYTGAKTGQLPAALVGGRVDVNIGASAVTQAVSGTVTANAGTGPFAIQATAAAPASVELSDGAAFYVGAKTGQLPAALVGGRVDVSVGAALPTGANTVGAVTQASGPWTTNGPGANQTAVSGNPNWIGGSTTAAGGNLQGVIVESATNPNLRVGIFSGASQAAAGAASIDASAAGNVCLLTVAEQYDFNAASWDRHRNNVDVTDLASASRTTTQTLADINVYNGHSLICVLDVTTVGTGSVTLTINYKDPASGKYILLLSGAAVTTNVTNTYTVNPNIAAVANVTAQKDLGRVIQLVLTSNNANAVVSSLGHTVVS